MCVCVCVCVSVCVWEPTAAGWCHCVSPAWRSARDQLTTGRWSGPWSHGCFNNHIWSNSVWSITTLIKAPIDTVLVVNRYLIYKIQTFNSASRLCWVRLELEASFLNQRLNDKLSSESAEKNIAGNFLHRWRCFCSFFTHSQKKTIVSANGAGTFRATSLRLSPVKTGTWGNNRPVKAHPANYMVTETLTPCGKRFNGLFNSYYYILSRFYLGDNYALNFGTGVPMMHDKVKHFY